ncbi:zinc-binding protein A33-like [Scyliorhinus canicula]|uniref:zinc-binding protein A33-like n=1 Tax=Scyliorhinus canicula TaxID=7830 RepID=UPI0018F5CB25|nr:zinc-binding protein A33-like [Scyliorhinus canicula]
MEAHESEFVLQANQKKLQKAIRDSSADLKSKENELKALSSVLQQTEELLYERDKELDVKCKSDSQKIAELRAENKELRASKMKGIISTEKELNASAKSLNDCESALETKTARALQTPDALKKENERLRLQLVQKIKELSDLKKGITPTAEAAIPAPTGRADLATQLDAAKKEKDTLQAKLAETILQLKDLKGKMKTGAKSDECKKILQRTMRQLLQKTAEINALQGTGTTLGPTGKTRASTEELYTECKKLLQASMRQLLLKDTEIEKLLAQLKAAAELLRAKEDELKECRDKLGGTGSSGKPSDDQDQEYIECKKLLQASMRQLLVKDIEIGKLIAQLKDAGLSPSSDDAPKDPTKEEEEKALREKVSELKKLLQAAMQELLLKDAELDKVTKQLEEAGDNISKKDKEMDDHRKSDDDRIREARTELQKLQQILEAVEQLLRLKDEELKQLKKQDPGVPTADYEKLKRDVEDKDRALDRKDAEIDSLKDRLREAEKKSAKSEDRDTLEAIQKDIVELLRLKDKELEELRKQGSKSAEQCNKELKDCKAELEKLRRELKSANDAIKNKQTDMDKHVKDDEDQIRETQLERQKIEAIRKNVEEILRRQEPDKDKIEEKDDEIKKLKKALQDLENKLRERESESANCNECMNKLKEKTKEAENKAADLRECERKLREKDKDFDDHKVEDDTRIRQAQSELEKLTNIQKDIEDLLALKNEELVKLREKCKKETNTGARSELEKLRDLEKQLKDKDAEIVQLRNKLGIKKVPRVKTPVIFDASNSDPRFTMHPSDNSAMWGDAPDKLSDKQKMYLGTRRLWGKEGFTLGSHYWEVEAEMGSAWFVGLSVGTFSRKSWLNALPSSGLWLVLMWNLEKSGGDTTRTMGRNIKIVNLLKVGVFLDFDNGKVVFSNPVTDAVLHSLTGNFTERLYPFVRYCLSEAKQAKIKIV